MPVLHYEHKLVEKPFSMISPNNPFFWTIFLIKNFNRYTFINILKAWNLAWWHYPIVVAGVMFLFLVAGYADRKLGLIKEEQRFYSTENPVIQEILKEARK